MSRKTLTSEAGKLDVRFGADMVTTPRHVRIAPDNGHSSTDIRQRFEHVCFVPIGDILRLVGF
jgi:hypothetical protein